MRSSSTRSSRSTARAGRRRPLLRSRLAKVPAACPVVQRLASDVPRAVVVRSRDRDVPTVGAARAAAKASGHGQWPGGWRPLAELAQLPRALGIGIAALATPAFLLAFCLHVSPPSRQVYCADGRGVLASRSVQEANHHGHVAVAGSDHRHVPSREGPHRLLAECVCRRSVRLERRSIRFAKWTLPLGYALFLAVLFSLDEESLKEMNETDIGKSAIAESLFENLLRGASRVIYNVFSHVAL